MRNRIGRTLSLITVGISAVVLALVAFAAPSWACSGGTSAGCVNASFTIPGSATLTGLTNIAMTYNPGTSQATGTEGFAVTTNSGYTITIEGTAEDGRTGPGFGDATSDYIADNSNLTIAETGGHGSGVASSAWQDSLTAPAPITLDTESAPGTFNYSENWTLAVPAAAASGDYSESFQYMITAS